MAATEITWLLLRKYDCYCENKIRNRVFVFFFFPNKIQAYEVLRNWLREEYIK